MLVGTLEPARVRVAIAQAASASAMANTAPPTQPAGAAAGMNGKGMSHCKASAASTASAHAIGGRMMTLAVSAVSLMARLVNLHSWRCKRFEGYLPASLNTCGTMLRTAVLTSARANSRLPRYARAVTKDSADRLQRICAASAAGVLGLPIIGRLLGHSQVSTTARYAHLRSLMPRAQRTHRPRLPA